MAVFAPYVAARVTAPENRVCEYEFRSPRGILLGGVLVYPSALQPGWKRYEVLRMVGDDLRDVAEGEAPNEDEAVRVAKFLVER